jgi:iron-sulfur cluster repair protein YtfE (RIC family)
VHFLQRQICLDMETLADTTTARPALALAVLTNLCRDLPLHHADEDEGLFPLLRQRALDEDEIDRLLTRLSADHEANAAAIQPLLPALACMADHALPAPEDRVALRALAQAERRHMIIENAILLPLAQARLTDADRRHLIASMAARRVTPPALLGPCARLSSHAPATGAAQTEGAQQ